MALTVSADFVEKARQGRSIHIMEARIDIQERINMLEPRTRLPQWPTSSKAALSLISTFGLLPTMPSYCEPIKEIIYWLGQSPLLIWSPLKSP